MEPFYRGRRLRKNAAIRSMIRETRLSPEDFVLPIFVVEGENIKEEIPSLPGIYHYSVDRLAQVVAEGPHQYPITMGAPNFRQALAKKCGRFMGRTLDPETEIVVTCGGTEAMMCAMMTICNPGDKVMVFSPFYENYGADAILCGATPIYIPLHEPSFNFNDEIFED